MKKTSLREEPTELAVGLVGMPVEATASVV
jgi:hypothetical protein